MFIVFATFLIVKLLNHTYGPLTNMTNETLCSLLFRHQRLFFNASLLSDQKDLVIFDVVCGEKQGRERERQKEVSSTEIPLRSSVTQQCLLGCNVMCVHYIQAKRYGGVEKEGGRKRQSDGMKRGVEREERERGHNQFADPISIMSSPVSIDLRRKLLTRETTQSCTLINVLVQILLICSTWSLKQSLNTADPYLT